MSDNDKNVFFPGIFVKGQPLVYDYASSVFAHVRKYFDGPF